jgi:NAD(P)-dependent dehydrogenase (short-subunit alcohol dehydrogenase family)
MTLGRPLDGHSALVTGCGRPNGMGRSIAIELARAGANVAVADLPLPHGSAANGGAVIEAFDALVDEITALGRRCAGVLGDVGIAEDAERMVDQAADALGHVDILVNNAAAPHGPDRDWTWRVPEAAWDSVLRTNTKGVFLMSSAVVRRLLAADADYGRIINIASTAALRGLPQRAAYSASKFAVVGLTQSMAWELATRRITVNTICPGTIVTDRHRDRAQQLASAEADVIPLPGAPVPRLGKPADIARTAVFLAHPASDFITGQSYSVDGGFSLV